MALLLLVRANVGRGIVDARLPCVDHVLRQALEVFLPVEESLRHLDRLLGDRFSVPVTTLAVRLEKQIAIPRDDVAEFLRLILAYVLCVLLTDDERISRKCRHLLSGGLHRLVSCEL